jgi:hypothetical protein
LCPLDRRRCAIFFQVGWKATPQKVTVLLKEEGAAYHQPNRSST